MTPSFTRGSKRENLKMKNLYHVEITDTFGGEANYSWVTRHVIRAKSPRGAINALSRRSGMNWHAGPRVVRHGVLNV